MSSLCIRCLGGAGIEVTSLPYPARGLDPMSYVTQIETMCSIVNAKALFVGEELLSLVPDTVSIKVKSFGELSSHSSLGHFSGCGSFVQFTSGSTREPKGVRLSPSAIGTNINAISERIEPRDYEVACSWLPLSHDMGFIGIVLVALACGAEPWGTSGQVVLMDPTCFLQRPSLWLDTWSNCGATITATPPFGLSLAARSLNSSSNNHSNLDLSRMRVCIIGGELIREEVLINFADKTASLGFNPTALCPAYGLAEATLAVSMVSPDEMWSANTIEETSDLESAKFSQGTSWVCCGKPLAGMNVRVSGNGQVGKLELASQSLFDGYVMEEISPKVSPWQEIQDEKWFRTSDLGFLDSGQVHVVSRSDNMLIIAGRNLPAEDVEWVVSSHETVRDGCCAAVADGNGGYIVVAEPSSIVPDSEIQQAQHDIRVLLTRQLSIAPTDVTFIERGGLPKTPSGKIQRWKLLELLNHLE